MSKMIRYMRHPKTHNESKLNDDPEIQQYIRPKRLNVNLPNARDDIKIKTSKESKRNKRRSKSNFRNSIREIEYNYD